MRSDLWASMVVCAAALLVACGARSGLTDDAPDGAVSREACNGEDDDGDGAIDEAIADVRCGVGVCERTAPGCVAGAPGVCMPGAPNAEICDGIDNDCDGAADDGLDPELLSGPFTILGGPFSRASELIETPDGLLAVIGAYSIDGEPRNAIVTRRVGFDGEPIGEPLFLDDIRLTEGPTATASAEGRIHLTVCAGRGSENELGTFVVDPDGTPVSELVFRSPTRSCGAAESFSIWTGERYLTSWTENSSAPTFDQEILFDVSDADGRSERSEVLLAAGGDLSAQPYFLRASDRVVMVSGRSTPPDVSQQLQTWVFSLSGERLAGPIVHATPDGFQPIDPRLVPTAGGDVRVLVPNRFGDGIVTARITLDGELREAPRFVEDAPLRYAYADMKPIPGGGSVASATVYGDGLSDAGEVLGFDDDARVTFRYRHRVEGEGYFAWSSVLPRAGRFYVLYSTNLSEAYFEERLVILGCRP